MNSTGAAPLGAGRFAESAGLRWRDIFCLVPRTWPFIRPVRKHLLILLLSVLPALPAGLFALQMTRVFFDVIGQGKPFTHSEALLLQLPITASREVILWRACVLTAILALLAIPCALSLFTYAVWILQRITNQFRVDLYARLQELSLRFHSEEKIGDAIFRMFHDSAAVPHVINGLVIEPLQAVPMALVNLGLLIIFDYRIALVAVALLPLDFALAAAFGGRLRRAFRVEREATAWATTRIEETLASIRAVKAFGREADESELYARDNWEAFLASRRARTMLLQYRVASNTLRSLAFVAAIALGAAEVMRGGTAGITRAAVSLGLFEWALAQFGGFSSRAVGLVNQWGILQDAGVAFARVFELMEQMPEERVTSGSMLPPPVRGSLSFEAVSFAYSPGHPVLSNVSFQARVGEITALVGPSGSGKSTIIALALRFFDPDRGRLVLDGHDLRGFQLAPWRSMVSVVLQENPLFSGTLRENIAYGRLDAPEADIMRAAARAGLAAFVRALPAGLDTVLGEKGARLSGGQQQRIGLARALVRPAPILILDEPTSALDSATEELAMRGVREWLAERPGERIVLLATHRQTTAASAHRVCRLAGAGEQGAHAAFVPLRAGAASDG